ncbi:MAG: putative GTP-binding protein EngB [Tenericutes bacterium ADurb.Bin087]|nr:MAG: putative GTP-binding protein EngB [Tenericutes bacterium ADurb.Bin087]
MNINFQNTMFLGSFTAKHDGVIAALPEIIFIGRSNVGKSSLINAIINRKNLAYTSKKPGFTKLLNYYNVDDKFYLVDAPGYGYAKGEKDLSVNFATMMNNYFYKNANLSMIYLLIDSRRTLSEDDEAFLSFVSHHNFPLTIIFTKCDKLNQSMRAKALNFYKKTFKGEVKAIFTSSHNRENIDQIHHHICEVVKKR